MAFKSSMPTATGDFTVLALSIPPVSTFPHESTHYIYLKPHSPSTPSPESSRSLFLANIPADTTSTQLRSFFAREELGGTRVEEVEFEGTARAKKGAASQPPPSTGNSKKRKRGVRPGPDGEYAEPVPALPETWDREILHSGSTAVVTFVDRASMEIAHKAVKRAAKQRKAPVWSSEKERDPRLGMARYKAHHALRFPPSDALQAAVDAYMTEYASLEQARTRAAQRKAGVPDDDGFVTVVRGSRVGAAKVDERRAAELREAAERKRQKDAEKREGLGDFYRFQGRERRKKEAEGLVRKFEGERQRVLSAVQRKRLRPE